jgi:hypothetical protein
MLLGPNLMGNGLRRDTQRRRRPCHNRGRAWSEATTSQGVPGTPGAGRGKREPPIELSEDASPAHTTS